MNKQNQDYKAYVYKHIANVKKGFEYLIKKGNHVIFDLNEEEIDTLRNQINEHDSSKYEDAEFYPYSNWFFGEKNDQTKAEFREAVKLHKSRHPHHPEYWTDENGVQDMPFDRVIEMIADWWTFGIEKKDYFEILSYYNNNKTKFNFSSKTQKNVDILLKFIKESSPSNQDFYEDSNEIEPNNN